MFETVRLCESSQIEPMPGPTLTVVWGSKQPINQFFVSVRGTIMNESVNLLDGRRQTDQGKTDTANELLFCGARRQLELFGLKLQDYEAVDGVLNLRRSNRRKPDAF